MIPDSVGNDILEKSHKALPSPSQESLLRTGSRKEVYWGTKFLQADRADGSFYRISGVTGSGKSHLTKLFLLDTLKEIENNPCAKLIVYEPKREFYAWIQSVKESYGLRSQVRYFMPSDKRSVSLDFTKDFRSDQDARTLAHAFYPVDNREQTRFWGDSLRTIYAAIFTAIKKRLGYADLRLMCLVLENERYMRILLKSDPYLMPAQCLAIPQSDSRGTETAQNIMMTINSRISEMKVLASHFDANKEKNGLLSIRDFVRNENEGILVVSKDADYHLIQDPMNGVFFNRLMQLLDKEQADPRRKVFIIIDEFPTLAGDNPCPGIKDMFLRLRSRGVCLLIAYQGYTTLKGIYGDDTKGIIGQCSNLIYLRQPDSESAQYASEDLGMERGREFVASTSIGGNAYSVTRQPEWYDRPTFSPTDLMTLFPASAERGVEGYARSGELPEKGPWHFEIAPGFIDGRIPNRHPHIPEYEEWNDEAQRLRPLTDAERLELLPELFLDDE